MSAASPPRPGLRLAVRSLAVLLALAAAGAALRAVLRDRETSPARALLVRLSAGLCAAQGPDGSFDPAPGREIPEVLRTAGHALAAAALVRARLLGLDAEVPDLARCTEAALDALLRRQGPGGTFGALDPAARNPWPGVEATAGATLALALGGRPQDARALEGAVAGLERTAAYDLRDGWTRGLVALALEAAGRVGGPWEPGRDPRGFVASREDPDEGRCDDPALAEAVVRWVRGEGGRGGAGRGEAGRGEGGRGGVDALPARILSACAEVPPRWEGEETDLRTWWMTAWLAARTPGVPGSAAWLAGLPGALEMAGWSRSGLLAGGLYADALTQTACAVLALGEAAVEEGGDPPVRGR